MTGTFFLMMEILGLRNQEMSAVFTCSTDDGHPSDMKMAELLSKNGLNGTFFIPIKNREGLPVMSKAQIRNLGRQFEIGSHTYDHCYLKNVDLVEANRQITEGKKQLEDLLGTTVTGFCYPGGKYRDAHAAMVQSAGFKYARTTMNLCFDTGHSRFEIPTTIQFYPHPKAVYLRNFVKAGRWRNRTNGLKLALRHSNWLERLYALFDYSCKQESVFHLWAHSDDIDKFKAWSELDQFFAYVAKKVAIENRLSNQQLALREFFV
jgi:peptidoglycan/xylan/chitin deacetylase (PgdA/CDA1 family)